VLWIGVLETCPGLPVFCNCFFSSKQMISLLFAISFAFGRSDVIPKLNQGIGNCKALLAAISESDCPDVYPNSPSGRCIMNGGVLTYYDSDTQALYPAIFSLSNQPLWGTNFTYCGQLNWYSGQGLALTLCADASVTTRVNHPSSPA
jgi:hypothetical protein